MHNKACLIALAASLFLFSPIVMAADADHPAARVVIDFNEAVTARDMDTAMPLLAEGSIQFNLRPAHPGLAGDTPLSAELITSWKMVSSILFPTTDSYERTVEVTSAQADGELAIVWTRTRTATKMKGKEDLKVTDFSEMYFLVNKDNTGWKIAGTASNRPVDDLDVSNMPTS